MFKREILLTGCAIVLALSGQEANAAEACTVTPTCAELGYSKTSCGSAVALKCPFDKTKMFCAPQTYEAGEVIKLNGTSIGVAVNSHLAIAMGDEGNLTWTNAISKCQAKTTGGKSWRLPTRDDVNAMKAASNAIETTLRANGITVSNSGYWTSEEANYGYSAYFFWLGDSAAGYYDKNNRVSTLCVTAL